MNNQSANSNIRGDFGFFIPFTFEFHPSREPQQSPQATNNQTSAPHNFTTQGNQNQIFFVSAPGTNTIGQNGQPPIIFFTPIIISQQEVYKPHASEAAMKKLPIITITQKHVDSQATCPICLEAFSLTTPTECSDEKQEQVRQMPCNHIFCESCLFVWLKQSNTCPLCRCEIESKESISNNTGAEQVPLPQLNINSSTQQTNTVVMTDVTSSETNDSLENTNSQPSPERISINCALANVDCCGELYNNNSHVHTPIITLPQCHHQFHASCLRTSLIVEGYTLEPSSRPLSFHCPTCRAPALIETDLLK